MDIDIWPWISPTDPADNPRHLPTQSLADNPASLTLIRYQGWFRWLPLLLAVPLSLVTLRLIVLQVVHGADFRQQTEHNRLRVQILPAPRGAIIDHAGQPLVQNVPDFTLNVTPAELPTNVSDRRILLQRVADISHTAFSQVTTLVNDPRHRRTDPVTIVDHVGYDQALSWMVETSTWAGVGVTAVPARQYPLGSAGAPVIGYIGKISERELQAKPGASIIDVTGKAGIEKTYDDLLRGHDGRREVERNVLSQGQRTVINQAAVPGATVQLSLDGQLQQRLFDRLVVAIKQAHSTAGAAVAINPQNGEILALVSAPSYDDNWFVSQGHQAEIQAALSDKHQPLLNRAIAGQYPSGSIIKPLIGTAALAEGIVTPRTTVVSTGGLKVGLSSFPDWKSGGHGVTNLSKAIAESVNTYFYEIGGGYEGQTGLGVDRIVRYLQLFGWGQLLGIDIPGEMSGLVPTKQWRTTVRPTPWRLGDTYHLAIGQGDLEVTPLQVAAAMAAVANSGTLYQPHLVTKILDPNGRILKTISPTILQREIAGSGDFAAVRDGMRQGVLSGSSQAMNTVPVPVAGKTGTAQFGVGNHTHAWYTAFAPYDHPTIAVSIVIEGGGQGHEIALPVAKDIFTWYFSTNR